MDMDYDDVQDPLIRNHVPSSSSSFSRPFRQSQLNNSQFYEEHPAYLKLLNDWDVNLAKRIILTPPKVTIGRALNNDVVMSLSEKSKSVGFSRHHCEFFLSEENNKWFVRNLSQNGLRVNGIEIMKNEARELENSDFVFLLLYDGPQYEFREQKYSTKEPIEKNDETPTPSDLSDDEEYFDCAEHPISELESEKQALNLAKSQLKMLEIENKLLQFKSLDTDMEEQEKIEQERRNLAVAEKELDGVKECSYKTVVDTMMTYFKCPICDKLPIHPMILNCGHTLCSFCLSEHQKNKPVDTAPCPKCSYEISYSMPHVCLRNFIPHSMEILPKEYELERERHVAERAKQIAAVAEEEKQKQEELEKLKPPDSNSTTNNNTSDDKSDPPSE